jgi:hypothetical protein
VSQLDEAEEAADPTPVPVVVNNLNHTIKQEQTGEAGTASKKGRAATVVLPEVSPYLRALVNRYNTAIQEAYSLLEGTLLEKVMPVARVQLIHVDNIQANDYNPNAVAGQEMKLLHTSIAEDGFTQPVVAIWDPEVEKYTIVDGFHRFTTMRRYQDIVDNSKGYMPVVVLDKSIADRIASTVRHNRARGKHSVAGMGSLVFQMLEAGEDDATICRKLGLEAEELARLKHITGFSKLFADRQYSKVVTTKAQNEARAAYAREHPGEPLPEGV